MQDKRVTGTLMHELFFYEENDGIGEDLLALLRIHVPNLTAEQCLRIEFGSVNNDTEFELTFLTAAYLYEIWSLLRTHGTVKRPLVHAQLEARLAILRIIRYKEHVISIEILLNFM